MIFCLEPYVHMDIMVENNVVKTKPCNIYYGSETSSQVIEMHNKGVWPDGCKSCKFANEHNQLSRQKGVNKLYTDKGITRDGGIQAVSFRYGTLCNLRCPICSYIRSSAWANEDVKFGKDIPDRFIFDQKKMPDVKDVLAQTGVDASKVKVWDLHGGEPLLNDYPWEILKMSPDAHFKINTNGTVFPEKMKEFQGHDVELLFSIDDINERFEYLRYPANFEKVTKNIQLAKEYGFRIGVTPAISSINLFYFPEFAVWLVKNFGTNILMQYVDEPAHYAINNLNDKVKEIIIDKFEKHKLKKFLRPIVEKIQQPQDKDVTFFSKVAEIDRRRNNSFSATFPEWSDILNENTMHR
jgi:sulfatase maturation enzyme AslB (radical SAM superfamily)